MINRHKLSKKTLILALFISIGLISISVNAKELQPLSVTLKSLEMSDKADKGLMITNLSLIDFLEKRAKLQLDEIKSLHSSQDKGADDKIESLRAKISSVELAIEGLKEQAKTPVESGMSFEVWAGVVLGAVAVIVTTLGVGIAIFSFFGYREIMRRSTEIATETAGKIAPEVAKSEITERINSGDFDTTIETAVQKITFRGIISGPEYDQNNSDDT